MYVRFFRALVCLLCASVALPLVAAAPITHAYLAEQYLERFPYSEPQDRCAFLIGNQFPDIRYLGGIPREATHFAHVTLEEIRNEPSPFIAGMKLHTYVDNQRMAYAAADHIYDYLVTEGLLDVIPNLTDLITTLKLIEDQLLYTSIARDSWFETMAAVLDAERTFGLPEAQLTRWHQIITVALALPPTTYSPVLLQKVLINFSTDQLEIMLSVVHTYSDDPRVQAYVSGLAAHFTALFDNAATTDITQLNKLVISCFESIKNNTNNIFLLVLKLINYYI